MDDILRFTEAELKEFLVHVKSIFQEARLLDTNCSDYWMACEDGNLGKHEYNCFKIWNRNHRCDNCISCKVLETKKNAHKFELMDDQIFVVFAKYVEVDGVPHVVEMLSPVGNDMIKNGDVNMPFKDAIKHTNHELYIDALLDVYNRRFYEEQTLTLDNVNAAAFIDIDYFKKTNDTYGHAFGDAVLKSVASSLKRKVRDGDAVIRMGGDEFLVLFVDMPADRLESRLLDIKRDIQQTKFDEHPEYELGISVGGCSFKQFSHELVDVADAQMYKVKHVADRVAVKIV